MQLPLRAWQQAGAEDAPGPQRGLHAHRVHVREARCPAAPPAAALLQLVKVQQAIEVVQKKMRQYDGSFVQFRADEKVGRLCCGGGSSAQRLTFHACHS